MKVIFLDIDGVLNSHQYLSRSDMEDRGVYRDIDPEKVKLLKQIVERTGADIVLSSSWRTMLMDDLQPMEAAAQNLLAILAEHGLVLYGKTVCLQEERGAEIREWLSHHKDIDAFVILDDDVFADWNELDSHWVKTSYYIGLTEKEAAQAIGILCAEGKQ